MNRAPAVRTISVLAAVLAVGAPGRAQNPEGTSAVPPSRNDARSANAEDSIAAAKLEFEAVKSLRDLGLQPKSGLPQMAVPQMPTRASPSLPGPKLKTPEGEKRQSNWLVDALARPTPAKPTPARSGREADAHSLEENSMRGGAREDGAKAGSENERKEQPGSINPFAPFLGDWMSPRDYALLISGPEQPASSAGLGPNGPTRAAVAEGSAMRQATGLGSNGGFEAKFQTFGGTTTVRENPYLQALASPVPGPSMGAGAIKPLPATAVPPSASKGGMASEIQTRAAPPKAKIPEFLRPTTDEKHFKQLKRF